MDSSVESTSTNSSEFNHGRFHLKNIKAKFKKFKASTTGIQLDFRQKTQKPNVFRCRNFVRNSEVVLGKCSKLSESILIYVNFLSCRTNLVHLNFSKKSTVTFLLFHWHTSSNFRRIKCNERATLIKISINYMISL